MNLKDIPNIICTIRILLVFPIIVLLVQHNFNLALILFIIAGISDGLDGYLARKYNWKTELGGWLDPVADKTLQVSVYIVLTWLGLIPWWLLLAWVFWGTRISSSRSNYPPLLSPLASPSGV